MGDDSPSAPFIIISINSILYLFVLWGSDKSSTTFFAYTQKAFPFFFIPNAIENVKLHFKPVSLSTMGTKFRWHLITPFLSRHGLICLVAFYELLPSTQDGIDNGLNLKEHLKMDDKKKWDTQPLIRCENEDCRQLCTEFEVEQGKGKCPYCGKWIKTEDESS